MANQRPPLDDDEFKHREYFHKPIKELEDKRAEIYRRLNGVSHHSKTISRLRRQGRWLTNLIREKNFWARLRKMRGAPESKEERINMFNRAFFAVARSELEPDVLKSICQLAQELMDDECFENRDK